MFEGSLEEKWGDLQVVGMGDLDLERGKWKVRARRCSFVVESDAEV